MLLLIQGEFFTPEQSAQIAMIVVTLLSAISGPFSAACWYLTLKIRAAQQEFQAEQRAKDELAANAPKFIHSRREDGTRLDRHPLSPVQEAPLEGHEHLPNALHRTQRQDTPDAVREGAPYFGTDGREVQ